jgi:hypothetical protein
MAGIAVKKPRNRAAIQAWSESRTRSFIMLLFFNIGIQELIILAMGGVIILGAIAGVLLLVLLPGGKKKDRQDE